jgi:hypothetical protein
MITKENSNVHKKRRRIYPNNFQKIIRDAKDIAKKYIYKIEERVDGKNISLVVIAKWRQKFLVTPQFSNIDPNREHNANGYIIRYKSTQYKITTFEDVCKKIKGFIDAQSR